MHYNIQSISSKVDLIGSELRNFNIICLTETWLNQNTPDDSLKINEFNFTAKTDRLIITEAYASTLKKIYTLVEVQTWSSRPSSESGSKLILIILSSLLNEEKSEIIE